MKQRQGAIESALLALGAWARETLARRGDVLLIAALPVLLVLVNSNWIFNPVESLPGTGFADPWFHTGHFLFLRDYAVDPPASLHYWVERLPWLLPGFYLYRFLGPLAANYILHLASYLVAAFSVYSILRNLLQRRSAIIAAIAMGTYPWFLRAVGWDYPDGAGLAYYSLSLALVVASWHSRMPRLLLMGAGMATACAVFTNLLWIPLVGLALLVFAVARRSQGLRSLLRSIWFLGLGALSVAAFFAVCFQLLAGRPIFFDRSLFYAFSFPQDPGLVGTLRLFYGSLAPHWLILPAALASATAIAVIRGWLAPASPLSGPKLAIAALFALSAGFFVALHGLLLPYLIMYPYVSYLIPSSFLLFGALLSNALDRLTAAQFRLVWLGSLSFLVLPLGLTRMGPVWEVVVTWQGSPLLLLLAGSILAASLVISQFRSVLLACAALAALGFLGGGGANVFIRDPARLRNSFVGTMAAVAVIKDAYPHNDQQLLVAYDVQDYDVPGLAVGGVYLDALGRRNIALRPDGTLPWGGITPFPDSNVVLISGRADAYDLIDQQFRVYSDFATLTPQGQRLIRAGSRAFHLYFLHLLVDPRPLRTLELGDRFEFDSPFRGRGFYPLEVDARGQTYVWSGPDLRSLLEFASPSLDRDVPIRLCALFAWKPAIAESLELSVNDTPVALGLQYDAAGCPIYYTGTIPRAAVFAHPSALTLELEVSATVAPAEIGIDLADHRKLGIALDWIEIR